MAVCGAAASLLTNGRIIYQRVLTAGAGRLWETKNYDNRHATMAYLKKRRAGRNEGTMLTDEQRAEFEALGAEWVRSRLAFAGSGREAAVYGFKKGVPTRGDVTNWLMEKEAQAKVQKSDWQEIGRWAIAAVVVSIIVIIAIVWHFQSR